MKKSRLRRQTPSQTWLRQNKDFFERKKGKTFCVAVARIKPKEKEEVISINSPVLVN